MDCLSAMPAHAGQAWHVYFVALAKDDGDGGCLREVRARRRGTRRSTKTNDVTTWIAVLWLAKTTAPVPSSKLVSVFANEARQSTSFVFASVFASLRSDPRRRPVGCLPAGRQAASFLARRPTSVRHRLRELASQSTARVS